jgi:hypothetical protein
MVIISVEDGHATTEPTNGGRGMKLKQSAGSLLHSRAQSNDGSLIIIAILVPPLPAAAVAAAALSRERSAIKSIA